MKLASALHASLNICSLSVTCARQHMRGKRTQEEATMVTGDATPLIMCVHTAFFISWTKIHLAPLIFTLNSIYTLTLWSVGVSWAKRWVCRPRCGFQTFCSSLEWVACHSVQMLEILWRCVMCSLHWTHIWGLQERVCIDTIKNFEIEFSRLSHVCKNI